MARSRRSTRPPSPLALGSVAFAAAANSLVPDLVAPNEIVVANAGLWTVAVVGQIVLAPVAGLVIATSGVGAAFGVNAVSFLVSAAVLAGLRAGAIGADLETEGWRGMGAGFVAVREHPLLSRLLLVQTLAALSAGATSGLLVVLAADWLRVGPSGFGLLLSAIGIGAAAGPLALTRRIKPSRRLWLLAPLALRGVVDLVLAGTSLVPIAALALVAYGVGTSTGAVAFQATLQVEVPDQVRGRTITVFDVS